MPLGREHFPTKGKIMNIRYTVRTDDNPPLPVREPGQSGEDIGGSGAPMERQPVPWAK
jgi:hypothetical protein